MHEPESQVVEMASEMEEQLRLSRNEERMMSTGVANMETRDCDAPVS